ncbi:MAG: reactive intermediate/imine deaminase [Bacteroidetes bacterium RIFCSPLOWO2_02_FULL_36_8]|nr:MAG: reactive intermediate/imine deaminase [Bacteroidetes bacterium RIFCSPLOWO2_02_FULL_36_8]OFY69523.1 MAG: reactive intermediate/imine deaminase [Bacteroidetes bacterium RIFCSPLOWO2_12_FULL_37_12]
MKTILNSPRAPQPIGPYSQAVKANGFLFISGQIAIEPNTGNFINSDIKSETRQVLENIKAILETAGLNFSHVVKSTLFIKDMNQFKEINEIYETYFPEQPPARETVEVARLPKDAGVEISVVACAG